MYKMENSFSIKVQFFLFKVWPLPIEDSNIGGKVVNPIETFCKISQFLNERFFILVLHKYWEVPIQRVPAHTTA